MIRYDPLWETMKTKNISQYKLVKDYGIDKAQLHRLRKNMVVKTLILNTCVKSSNVGSRTLWNMFLMKNNLPIFMIENGKGPFALSAWKHKLP